MLPRPMPARGLDSCGDSLSLCPPTSRHDHRRSPRNLTRRGIRDSRIREVASVTPLDGWTLHRLRHSALTHDAEGGTSTPMLLARSRHASVRSLERYARPGVDAVARHVAAQDPAARRRS